MQTVANDRNFGVELGLVAQLLKIAAAADPKIRTRGSTRSGDRFRISTSDAKATFPEPDRPERAKIARRGERDEQRQTFRVRQSDASGQQALDFDFEKPFFVVR